MILLTIFLYLMGAGLAVEFTREVHRHETVERPTLAIIGLVWPFLPFYVLVRNFIRSFR